MLDSWVQRNFKTQGGKVGGWKPFKYGGRLNYDGKGSHVRIPTPWGVTDAWADTSAKLLQDKGLLRLSFTPFSSKKEAGIGSDLDYSETHNEKRRMLPISSEVRKDIRNKYEAWLKRSTKKAKL